MEHCLPSCDPEYCDEWEHGCSDFCSVYGEPEKHGVRLLETHSEKNLDYRFNMVILVEDLKTHQKYWARDSGCSCPSPFQWAKRVQDLTPLRGHGQEYRDAVRRVGGWSRYA